MKPISSSSTVLGAMAAGVAATTAWSLAVQAGADAVPARAGTVANTVPARPHTAPARPHAAGPHAARPYAAPAAPRERAAPAAGARLARLTIARMGLASTVREGVTPKVLMRGVGHYPGTAALGRKGNAVFLGHRTMGPAPFGSIDRLRKGDRVVFRTGARRFVYRVYASRIIAPSDLGVLAPVPFERGARPRRAVATLISCYPKGSDARRLVVFAVLKDTRPAGRSTGR